MSRLPPSPCRALVWVSGLTLVVACGAKPADSRGGSAGNGGAGNGSAGNGGTGAGGAGNGGTGSGGSGSGGTGNGGAGSGGASTPDGAAPVPDADSGLTPGDAGADAAPAIPTNARLQAWQLAPEGAPGLVLGIWDTKEQVHCSFVPDPSGQLRCLPDGGRIAVSNSTYVDAQCQTPLTWIQPDGGITGPIARPWSLPLARTGCDPVRYQVVRPLADGSAIYGIQGGRCQRLGGSDALPPAPGDVAFGPDDPARWERGTESSTRLSDRLRLAEILTPDGARFGQRLVDDRWTMACTLQPGSTTGTIDCRPPTLRNSSGLFANDTCTTSLFSVAACDSMAFIEDTRMRFALSAPFTGAVYGGGHVCEARGTGSAAVTETRYYMKGDPLGADAVAPAREATVGTARFRQRGLMRDDGGVSPIPFDLLSFASSPYFDSIANEDCRLVWSPDRQARCIPVSVKLDSLSYFADRACTRYITNCEKGDACDTQKVVRIKQGATRRYQATIAHATARRLDATDIFYLNGAKCEQIGAAVAGMIEPSGEIPFDTFPALPESHPPPAAP